MTYRLKEEICPYLRGKCVERLCRVWDETNKKCNAVRDTITITPSGDMARKAYYDRNAETIVKSYAGTVAAGTSETDGWEYEVPTGKLAIHSVVHHQLHGPIATAGRIVGVGHRLWDGSTWHHFSPLLLWDDTLRKNQVVTATFAMTSGQKIKGVYWNGDTASHWQVVVSVLTEFDE